MLRLTAVLVVFFTITPVFMLSVWTIERLRLPGRQRLARHYSKALCALLRVRIRVAGTPVRGQPALIVCNHVSWLDIPVLASIGPVAFVAKREVSFYPVVGAIAKLMRTVFVDRTRRHQTAEVNAAIAARLNEGHPVVLFAEGTSSDGNRVLKFRSALLGAVARVDASCSVLLQPASIGYTRIQGIPMGRQHRPIVAWYGDLDFTPHFKEFVRRGVVDVTVTFGTAVPCDRDTDRKSAARSIEGTVRTLTARALRDRKTETGMAA
jgi:1-acyl-sn-glycerol-3-phosphate acyltransferase